MPVIPTEIYKALLDIVASTPGFNVFISAVLGAVSILYVINITLGRRFSAESTASREAVMASQELSRQQAKEGQEAHERAIQMVVNHQEDTIASVSTEFAKALDRQSRDFKDILKLARVLINGPQDQDNETDTKSYTDERQ
jgi:uncharacterized membrane protein YdfJ with MMPL/SSD domain